MTGNGLRIMVVEDDFLVASKLASEIRANGDQVVGPFADIQDAIGRVSVIQGAILDVRMQGGTSFPVADFLADCGIPFVFLTGYDLRQIPFRFQDRGVFAKPSTASPLLANLHRQHDAILLEGEDSLDAVVIEMLRRARHLMPDDSSAERLVEGVLLRAIAEAGNRLQGPAMRSWLMTLLRDEHQQRGRFHLH
ncbi:hypothetical protein E4L95_06575 [Paracoccus liaowanqingii]|uniref:Response regulatory domain-containing protein n=1 Tax=Paracoccus liaowanqingii TaxID=2560053 RepID=A0A4Z1CLV5_9RHOB|nr:hypothetical protein [Paracoccus liaowanqingii]TGN62483.1 hypothetical protein E4L95_06575 [Paracoccus liaowanqingii]